MLKAETASEQLTALRTNEWQQKLEERAAKLPAYLHNLTTRAYEVNHLYESQYAAISNEQRQKIIADSIAAFQEMAELSRGERLQLFGAWFPTCAPYVERGWQMFAQLPYQTGYARKAFRSSELPVGAHQARKQWVSALAQLLNMYEGKDLRWFAAWTPYMGYGGDTLGLLFAAAIDAGVANSESEETPTPEEIALGNDIFDILVDSAKAEHEIGAFGRHVTRGLLVASRPEGWEFMEKMLLAAQRQEGLRQNILETIDEAHPEAFRRMLRIVIDHDMVRFSSVIRAVDVWFGFGLDSLKARQANAALTQVLGFMEDGEAAHAAIREGEAQTAYLAMWTLATQDAMQTIPLAADMLNDSNVERRFVAAHFLAELKLMPARFALVPVLEDPDLRVAWRAFTGIPNLAYNYNASLEAGKPTSEGCPDLFERLERFAARFIGKPEKNLDALVWEWMSQTIQYDMIGQALLNALGERSPKRMMPYLNLMDSYRRGQVADRLAALKDTDTDKRDLLLKFAQDRDADVCRKAFEALAKMKLTHEDAHTLEPMLKRKGEDVRRGLQTLLLTQSDADALQTAQRLLVMSNTPQRTAGLDMLNTLISSGREVEASRNTARAYLANPVTKNEAETRLLASMLDEERETFTLANGLGLFDPAQRTPGTLPQNRNVTFITPAAIACLKSLNDLIEANREKSLEVTTYAGREEVLLGNVGYRFPSPPNPNTKLNIHASAASNMEDEAPLLEPPLNELWQQWLADRGKDLRDADGRELERAYVAIAYVERTSRYISNAEREQGETWEKDLKQTLFGEAANLGLEHEILIEHVLAWLILPAWNQSSVDVSLDAWETTLALIPLDKAALQAARLNAIEGYHRPDWRGVRALMAWLNFTRQMRSLRPDTWTAEQDARLFGLLQWLDQPASLNSYTRQRPQFTETLMAYKAGAANETDLLDFLIGAPGRSEWGHDVAGPLYELSGRTLPAWCEEFLIISKLVARVRARVLDVELARGNAPTAATNAARNLRWSGGLATLARVLILLGKEPLARTGYGPADSRVNTFSHLLRATYPERTDTIEDFACAMREAHISEQRLVELALYAPQWAGFVEPALGWNGLAEGVWWIHAHTKDEQWNVATELRDEWKAQSAERTPLSAQSLVEGAVDVAWFGRVYGSLGPQRWAQLYDAAKYATGGGGYKRAQLFASAMLGELDKSDLLARVKDKRNQDALRALGLIPLAQGTAEEADALERYKVIQEFLRTSRQFGAQRQQSEKMATQTAMENLARTSGYADPARLEWAMEASAVADLANGPVSVQAGEAKLRLSINPLGKPELAIEKNGKPLKAVPAAFKKDPQVIEIQERKKDIERQGSRMKRSLEEAMCRGDVFTGAELTKLWEHPVLRPMIGSLIFMQEGDAGIIGYPTVGGGELERHDMETHRVSGEMRLRIAHPYDLLGTDEWHLWQNDCFRHERVQPFKQVFRELYVLTEAEADEKNISHRYDGHQLNPRQAMALLGGRMWVSSYGEGPRRAFHAENLTACVSFFEGFTTPAEVEGLTVNGVYFTKKGEWLPVPLTQVPPRVFSEAMRDVDLAVSVAHQGGVDPEASASTVEMRASLLRESLRLLKIKNVRFQSNHVMIDGQLGTYSVHLGSAVVHRQPGGALCIVPVHSQHRGRLFLPFADDDPKTAEVISKVLLLSNDTQIKDPVILEQILVK